MSVTSSTFNGMSAQDIDDKISAKLLQGWDLAQRKCPSCNTKLIKREKVMNEGPNFLHQYTMFNVPFCVSCCAHVVTDKQMIESVPSVIQDDFDYEGFVSASKGKILVTFSMLDDDQLKSQQASSEKENMLGQLPEDEVRDDRLPGEEVDAEPEERVDVQNFTMLKNSTDGDFSVGLNPLHPEKKIALHHKDNSEHTSAEFSVENTDTYGMNMRSSTDGDFSVGLNSLSNSLTPNRQIGTFKTVGTVDTVDERYTYQTDVVRMRNEIECDDTLLVTQSESQCKSQKAETPTSKNTMKSPPGASKNKFHDFSSINFSVRRDIATKVLGEKLIEGYSLESTQCENCGMPLMIKDEVTECVVCPELASNEAHKNNAFDTVQNFESSSNSGLGSENKFDAASLMLKKAEEARLEAEMKKNDLEERVRRLKSMDDDIELDTNCEKQREEKTKLAEIRFMELKRLREQASTEPEEIEQTNASETKLENTDIDRISLREGEEKDNVIDMASTSERSSEKVEEVADVQTQTPSNEEKNPLSSDSIEELKILDNLEEEALLKVRAADEAIIKARDAMNMLSVVKTTTANEMISQAEAEVSKTGFSLHLSVDQLVSQDIPESIRVPDHTFEAPGKEVLPEVNNDKHNVISREIAIPSCERVEKNDTKVRPEKLAEKPGVLEGKENTIAPEMYSSPHTTYIDASKTLKIESPRSDTLKPTTTISDNTVLLEESFVKSPQVTSLPSVSESYSSSGKAVEENEKVETSITNMYDQIQTSVSEESRSASLEITESGSFGIQKELDRIRELAEEKVKEQMRLEKESGAITYDSIRATVEKELASSRFDSAPVSLETDILDTSEQKVSITPDMGCNECERRQVEIQNMVSQTASISESLINNNSDDSDEVRKDLASEKESTDVETRVSAEFMRLDISSSSETSNSCTKAASEIEQVKVAEYLGDEVHTRIEPASEEKVASQEEKTPHDNNRKIGNVSLPEHVKTPNNSNGENKVSLQHEAECIGNDIILPKSTPPQIKETPVRKGQYYNKEDFNEDESCISSLQQSAVAESVKTDSSKLVTLQLPSDFDFDNENAVEFVLKQLKKMSETSITPSSKDKYSKSYIRTEDLPNWRGTDKLDSILLTSNIGVRKNRNLRSLVYEPVTPFLSDTLSCTMGEMLNEGWTLLGGTPCNGCLAPLMKLKDSSDDKGQCVNVECALSNTIDDLITSCDGSTEILNWEAETLQADVEQESEEIEKSVDILEEDDPEIIKLQMTSFEKRGTISQSKGEKDEKSFKSLARLSSKPQKSTEELLLEKISTSFESSEVSKVSNDTSEILEVRSIPHSKETEKQLDDDTLISKRKVNNVEEYENVEDAVDQSMNDKSHTFDSEAKLDMNDLLKERIETMGTRESMKRMEKESPTDVKFGMKVFSNVEDKDDMSESVKVKSYILGTSKYLDSNELKLPRPESNFDAPEKDDDAALADVRNVVELAEDDTETKKNTLPLHIPDLNIDTKTENKYVEETAVINDHLNTSPANYPSTIPHRFGPPRPEDEDFTDDIPMHDSGRRINKQSAEYRSIQDRISKLTMVSPRRDVKQRSYNVGRSGRTHTNFTPTNARKIEPDIVLDMPPRKTKPDLTAAPFDGVIGDSRPRPDISDFDDNDTFDQNMQSMGLPLYIEGGKGNDNESLLSYEESLTNTTMGSEALATILNKIESVKEELNCPLIGVNNEERLKNEISNQMEMAQLIERLASAAVAVKKMESIRKS